MGQLSQLISRHDLPTLIFLLRQQLYYLPLKSICLFSANTKLFKAHVTPCVHFHNRWHTRSTYVFELWVLNECVSLCFLQWDMSIYVHEHLSYLDQPSAVFEIYCKVPWHSKCSLWDTLSISALDLMKKRLIFFFSLP